MKKFFGLLFVVTLAFTTIFFGNVDTSYAGPAAPLTKVHIDQISKDGVEWESIPNSSLYQANTIIDGDYVYIRATFAGYSNTNLIYNVGNNITRYAKEYKKEFITSGNIVVGFKRYYKIPISEFTNVYSLQILGWSTTGTAQIWSNTISFLTE